MSNPIHESVQTNDTLQARFDSYYETNQFIPTHWHNSLEIVCVLEGHMDVIINEKLYALQDQEFIIINSADIHSTHSCGLCHTILLQFPYDFLRQAIPEYDTIRFLELHTQKTASYTSLFRILLQLQEVYLNKTGYFTLHFTSLLYSFLFQLLSQDKQEISSAVRLRSDRNSKRLKTVMAYVKKNYASPITLEEAAGTISLNPEYFCRFFKQNTGLTFLDYLNGVRLSHVHDMLLESDQNILEILELNGCTNYKLFLRRFKETYGCTPSQLRRG